MESPFCQGSEKEKISANELSQSESIKELLGKFVESLPARERQVIRLRFWRNKDFFEIADCLDISVSSVRSIFASAMKRLKMKKNTILNEYEKKETS